MEGRSPRKRYTAEQIIGMLRAHTRKAPSDGAFVHLEGTRSQSIETRGDKGGDRGCRQLQCLVRRRRPRANLAREQQPSYCRDVGGALPRPLNNTEQVAVRIFQHQEVRARTVPPGVAGRSEAD